MKITSKMLLFRKYWLRINSLTSCGFHSNLTFRHINLRLRPSKNVVLIWRDINFAIERLEIDETGQVKIPLDPKIESLREKLIYCDYIERNRLKFGYGTNKAIENVVKQRAKAKKLDELVNQPTYSIALKYLNKRNNDERTETNLDNEEKGVTDEPPKPIHMPYSATDSFSTKKTAGECTQKCSEPLPPINERYKKLYESYLVAKEVSKTLPDNNIKDLRARISEMEMQRPVDDVSNVPPDWMSDYEQFNEADDGECWESLYGTSNPDIPVSSTVCGGCGALLQCQDSAIPGYLPSELFVGLDDGDLKNTICQRCHFMKYYNTTLEVTVAPEVYSGILKQIQLKRQRAAVILIIDLTDFPCSIWPDLTTIIGKTTPVFVVGNKVDLLPRDSSQFLKNIERSLLCELKKAGLGSINAKHVAVVSGRTGYGIERLISKLNQIWGYKGDVYMIGCTNVGKSTLFNALLQSDFCKVQAVDLIQRATTSPWPGTTLNLLKFPILNPLRWRLYQRTLRRQAEQIDEQIELERRKRELTLKRDVTLATLQERIGRTFPRLMSSDSGVQAAYDAARASGKFGIDVNQDTYKNSRWCYDTPGVVHPDQILHLLTTEELLLTLPKKIISPRSFIFKPGQTLFLAGLGRIDLINGPEFIRITVFASDQLPITICRTENADYIYSELLHTEAFVVPINNQERLKIWPTLQSKEFTIEGIDESESAADVLLSSAGWVAITPKDGEEVNMRAWTPEGRGIYLRIPALLSKSITHRGPRIRSSAAYRFGRQVYTR